jgi:hypothetical protein
MAARYTLPPCVDSSVVSPTQRWLGRSAANCRFNRLGGSGCSLGATDVTRYRLRTRATSPSSCMSRMTRLRLTRRAFLWSSRWTRGLP